VDLVGIFARGEAERLTGIGLDLPEAANHFIQIVRDRYHLRSPKRYSMER
jgi:hypothetical protein